MTRLLVVYTEHPSDPAAFDRYYRGTHIPLVNKMPGLRSFTISEGKPAVVGGDLAPYLVAELDFDNQQAMQAAVASPEGQATVADLQNFAPSGVNIVMFDVQAEHRS